MKRLIPKISITVLVITILAMLPAYLGFYLPMRHQLEITTRENFLMANQLKETILNEYISRSVEGAISISSRTMIRRKLLDHLEGDISLQEIRDYTQPLYADGIGALEGILAAKRISNYKENEKDLSIETIVEFGDTDLITCRVCEEAKDEVHWEIESSPQMLLTVISPIKEASNHLGYDILIYDMAGFMAQMNDHEVSFSILNLAEVNEAKKTLASLKNHKVGEVLMYDDGHETSYLTPITSSDQYLEIKVINDLLYQDIDKISQQSFIRVSLGLLTLLIVSNGVIMTYAGRVLNKKELSRQKFESFANIDSLTGVYTRRAYDEYIKNRLSLVADQACIVMIDIDRFKNINDTHGHVVGDEVLQFVANLLAASLRCEDKVFRFGGDEFLLLLDQCSLAKADLTMQRFIRQMVENNPFNFKLSISYGLAEINKKTSYAQGLVEADQNMYDQKNHKKMS